MASWNWLLVAVWAAVAAVGMAGEAVRAKPAVGLPTKVIPATLGMQTKTASCSTQDIEAIKALGAKWIRRGFYWGKIEPKKGRYVFDHYDRILADCDANGLRVLGCLFGGNKLHEDDGQGGIQSEAGRQAFAAFAAALARHYKGRGIIWEIWNEPNVRTFWRKNGKHNSEPFAKEYTALVKTVVPAMRAADPDVFVMAGSVSCFWEPSFNWTDFCFASGIYESGISAWSVHPYGLKSPEMFTSGYARTRAIMAKYNVPADFPVLNSERGFAVKKTKSWEGNPENEGWAGGPEGRAMMYQAWHLVRQYMIDQMNGIGLTIWYEWAGKEFAITNGRKRRPAYHACATMIKQLSGTTFRKRLKLRDGNDYVLVFADAAGQETWVAWTAPPARETPDKTRDHEIVLPVAARGVLKLVDLFGKQSELLVKDGHITVALSGSPVYVRFRP